MRIETKTIRAGELLGEVEWDYDFRSHFNNLCSSDARKDEACEEAKDRLRRVEAAIKDGREILATTDGSWPRFGFHRVIAVGMYDGWPYWRPVPSVQTHGPLGPEWHSFSSITDLLE